MTRRRAPTAVMCASAMMRASSRHCERSAAVQNTRVAPLDCFVAPLLAMTGAHHRLPAVIASAAKQSRIPAPHRWIASSPRSAQ
jgi:hypothetical protein